MVAKLVWQKTNDDPAQFVVSGDITEFADLGRLQKELSPTSELDLAGIAQVNSTGVREWMKFMALVNAAGQQLVLRRCSVSFVNQLNMIRRFAGGAKIASILMPYACEECETQAERVLELTPGLDVHAALETPVKCASCGAMAVFDDLPNVYFAFLGEPKE
jgi:hypothetical protein